MCEQNHVVWTEKEQSGDGEPLGVAQIFEPDRKTPVSPESPLAIPEDPVTASEAATMAETRGATFEERRLP